MIEKLIPDRLYDKLAAGTDKVFLNETRNPLEQGDPDNHQRDEQNHLPLTGDDQPVNKWLDQFCYRGVTAGDPT